MIVLIRDLFGQPAATADVCLSRGVALEQAAGHGQIAGVEQAAAEVGGVADKARGVDCCLAQITIRPRIVLIEMYVI